MYIPEKFTLSQIHSVDLSCPNRRRAAQYITSTQQKQPQPQPQPQKLQHQHPPRHYHPKKAYLKFINSASGLDPGSPTSSSSWSADDDNRNFSTPPTPPTPPTPSSSFSASFSSSSPSPSSSPLVRDVTPAIQRIQIEASHRKGPVDDPEIPQNKAFKSCLRLPPSPKKRLGLPGDVLYDLKYRFPLWRAGQPTVPGYPSSGNVDPPPSRHQVPTAAIVPFLRENPGHESTTCVGALDLSIRKGNSTKDQSSCSFENREKPVVTPGLFLMLNLKQPSNDTVSSATILGNNRGLSTVNIEEQDRPRHTATLSGQLNLAPSYPFAPRLDQLSSRTVGPLSTPNHALFMPHHRLISESAGSPSAQPPPSPQEHRQNCSTRRAPSRGSSSPDEDASTPKDLSFAGHGRMAVDRESPYQPTSPSAAHTFPSSTQIKMEVDTQMSVEATSPKSSAGGAGGKMRAGKSSSSSTASSAGKRPSGKSISGEEECLICGDRASGYHYSALSCEGCKGFFRRSITKGGESIYKCKNNKRCLSEMDMWMRRKCQACRLARCIEVGMRKDCLLSEEQCKARQEKRKPSVRSRAATSSTSTSSPQPATPAAPSPYPGRQSPSTATPSPPAASFRQRNPSTSSTPQSVHSADGFSVGSPSAASSRDIKACASPSVDASNDSNSVEEFSHLKVDAFSPSSQHDARDNGEGDAISTEDWDLLNTLNSLQDRYELPNEIQRQKVKDQLGDEIQCVREEEKNYHEMLINCILTVQLIVEFVKEIPQFEQLPDEDKVILLKGCSLELMVLRAARRYEPATGTIVFSDNNPWTPNNFKQVESGTFVDPMFHFCKEMASMKVDDYEYALLSCISIFSDREGLQHREAIEEMQMKYALLLQKYERDQKLLKKGSKKNFANLLGKLPELARISHEHSEMLFTLKIGNTPLPPLLAEIWNMS